MLLVGSKTEAGFIVFCDTLVTANLVVRLRHIFERLNAECRPPKACFHFTRFFLLPLEAGTMLDLPFSVGISATEA